MHIDFCLKRMQKIVVIVMGSKLILSREQGSGEMRTLVEKTLTYFIYMIISSIHTRIHSSSNTGLIQTQRRSAPSWLDGFGW